MCIRDRHTHRFELPGHAAGIGLGPLAQADHAEGLLPAQAFADQVQVTRCLLYTSDAADEHLV